MKRIVLFVFIIALSSAFAGRMTTGATSTATKPRIPHSGKFKQQIGGRFLPVAEAKDAIIKMVQEGENIVKIIESTIRSENFKGLTQAEQNTMIQFFQMTATQVKQPFSQTRVLSSFPSLNISIGLLSRYREIVSNSWTSTQRHNVLQFMSSMVEVYFGGGHNKSNLSKAMNTAITNVFGFKDIESKKDALKEACKPR